MSLRVLIVKLHAIGDVAMCLPIVSALRQRDQNARISWLCSESLAPLVELLGDIEIIRVRERTILGGSALDKGRETIRLWRQLFGRSFDLIISGYMDSRARLLTLTAIGKERRKCAPRKDGWWAIAGRYQADEYLRMMTRIDGPEMKGAELPVFRIPLSDRMRSLLGDRLKPFIALAPGGAKNALVESPLRRWPLDSYRSLAQSLLLRGYDVIITGGPNDDWVSKTFSGLGTKDLVGKTSLIELLALYGASAGMVTHDSGPLHLAFLARTPTVALFGPTMPQEKVFSYERSRIIWGGKNLPCRPCYDGKTYANCTNNRCMEEISVAAVVEAIEDIVDWRVPVPGKSVDRFEPNFKEHPFSNNRWDS
jgi:heptosyltransferase II